MVNFVWSFANRFQNFMLYVKCQIFYMLNVNMFYMLNVKINLNVSFVTSFICLLKLFYVLSNRVSQQVYTK